MIITRANNDKLCVGLPIIFIEGSLEVKLPTIWTDEKKRWKGTERRERLEERSVEEKDQKKEDAGARKGRKVAKHCVFPMICGSWGSKSRLAKAAGCGASWPDERWKFARRCGAKHISKSKCTKHTIVGPLLEVAMSKKCTPLWREADFEVKMYKAHQVRTTFGSWDVEKVHAVVARSRFRSQNVKKNQGFGPLLEVQMSKKCTPLWREAYFEVKMLKTPGVRTTFGGSDVETVHAVVARRTFRSQNVKNTRGSDHFWRFRCRFASLHYTT